MILTIHRHVISRIPRYSVTYDNSNTWLLHVSQAQQDDRGYYMCQVNTNPMISQVGYLQVVGKFINSKNKNKNTSTNFFPSNDNIIVKYDTLQVTSSINT